ncbi:hypothetical protein VCHENC02_0713B, partial [Vibrio harveyi]
SILLVVSKI